MMESTDLKYPTSGTVHTKFNKILYELNGRGVFYDKGSCVMSGF